MPDTTIVQDHKKNFETLRKAFASNQVCLMDCTLNATGEHVAVICAVNLVSGEYQMVPFAMFLNGNPYELLTPPSP
jgi:hypothetical protein